MNLKCTYTLKCPVCGEEVDMFDICENCTWHNNGPNEKENDLLGPNKMRLKEAKEAYKKKAKSS